MNTKTTSDIFTLPSSAVAWTANEFARASIGLLEAYSEERACNEAEHFTMIKGLETALLGFDACSHEAVRLQRPKIDGGGWQVSAQKDLDVSILRVRSSIHQARPPTKTFRDWHRLLTGSRIPLPHSVTVCDPCQQSVGMLMGRQPPGKERGRMASATKFLVDLGAIYFERMRPDIDYETVHQMQAKLAALTTSQKFLLVQVCSRLDIGRVYKAFKRLPELLTDATIQRLIFLDKFACAYYRCIFDRLNAARLHGTELPLSSLYQADGLESLTQSLYSRREIETIRQEHERLLLERNIHCPNMMVCDVGSGSSDPGYSGEDILHIVGGSVRRAVRGNLPPPIYVVRSSRGNVCYLQPSNTSALERGFYWRTAMCTGVMNPHVREIETHSEREFEQMLCDLLEIDLDDRYKEPCVAVYFYHWGHAASVTPVTLPSTAPISTSQEVPSGMQSICRNSAKSSSGGGSSLPGRRASSELSFGSASSSSSSASSSMSMEMAEVCGAWGA